MYIDEFRNDDDDDSDWERDVEKRQTAPFRMLHVSGDIRPFSAGIWVSNPTQIQIIPRIFILIFLDLSFSASYNISML